MAEIKAVLTGEKSLDSTIYLEPLRGAQGYSAYEVAVKNGYEGSEIEWLDSLSKSNYYRLYDNTFIATEDTTEIAINLDIDYRETDMLSVFINGFKAVEDIDFEISGQKIVLKETITEGAVVYYAIPRTLVATDEDYELLRGPEGKVKWDDNTEQQVKFKKYTTSEIENLPIEDGSVLFDTETQTIYLDNNSERLPYGNASSGGGSDVIGSIKLWPTDTPPKGYLLCDGSAISRTIYADLFNVIGTTYGAGDGTTTFNIPNIKGRVVVGKDSSDIAFDTLGETGGEKEHTLTGDEMPKHNHNGVFTINDSNIGTASVGTGEQTGWRQSNGSYGIQIQVPNAGGSQPHNNLQPYIVEHYIIKATKEATEETTVEAIPVGAIVDYEGTEVPVGYEEVTETTYSTDEIDTGEKWVDGKTIYKKSFVGTYADNTTLISGVDTLVKFYGTATLGLIRAVPYSEVYDGQNYIGTINILNNDLRTVFILQSASVSSNIKITVEYTKTN